MTITKEITEKEFRDQMKKAIKWHIENLTRNEDYLSEYESLRDEGKPMLYYQNPNETVFFYKVNQPLANIKDETMMIA